MIRPRPLRELTNPLPGWASIGKFRSAAPACLPVVLAALLGCSSAPESGGGLPPAPPLAGGANAGGNLSGGTTQVGGSAGSAGEAVVPGGGGNGTAGASDQPNDDGPEWTPPEDVLRWSDPATWGGRVPADGDAVVIPPGKSVLLDTDAAPGSLDIEGNLFCDNRDLKLSAESIMVHGRLQCGAEDAPFRHAFELTLTGSDEAADVMGMGNKVLGAMGTGAIELHGAPRTSWTHLAATAEAGSKTLRLATPTDWRAGDRIVVASTDFDMNQAEERSIVAVSATGELTLDMPLAFTHWGKTEEYGNGKRTWLLDERAEVGLVDRNIVIQGDDASKTNGFGGHLMVMRGTTLKLSNIEATRMGQRGKLARYPIHWHLAGDVTGQYVKSSSIHHTFNRCVTIHGSQHVLLQNNLCYDNPGHAIFLEDGVETGNVIDGNLGLLTRRPSTGSALLASDHAARGTDPLGPATFWITNPDNTITNNVAAGSDGSGFWFGVHDAPTGPSAGIKATPSATPLNKFDKNVIHSTAGMAMVLGAASMDAEGSYYNPTEKAVFTNSSYYKTRARGIWAHGNNMRFENWVIADNVRGAFFSFRSELASSAIIGESPNLGTPVSVLEKKLGRSLAEPKEGGVAGYVLYDGPVLFENVHFAGFARDDDAVHVFANNGAALHQMNNVFRGITFAPDTRRIYPDAATFSYSNGQRHAAILDEDGSISGRPGSYLLPNLPINVNNSCVQGPWTSKLWASCMNRYGVIRNRADFGDGFGKGLVDITVTRSDGPSVPLFDVNKNWYQLGVIMSSTYRYRWDFPAGKFPRVAQLSVQGVGATDGVVVELSPAPAAAQALVGGKPAPAASSVADCVKGAVNRAFRQGDSLFIKIGSGTVEVR